MLIWAYFKLKLLPCLLTDFDHSKSTGKLNHSGKSSCQLFALKCFLIFLINFFQKLLKTFLLSDISHMKNRGILIIWQDIFGKRMIYLWNTVSEKLVDIPSSSFTNISKKNVLRYRPLKFLYAFFLIISKLLWLHT